MSSDHTRFHVESSFSIQQRKLFCGIVIPLSDKSCFSAVVYFYKTGLGAFME